jgi:adenosylhomocysteine nucleosidase
MERVGIVAAMAGEVAPLVRLADLKRVTGGRLNVFESDRFVVAYAGMGRERVMEACEAVCARGPVCVLVSAGWVGSLHRGVPARSVQRPAVVIDAESGERFEAAGGSGVLLTVTRVASAAEKQELATQWGGDVVDMEAAHVARFAQERGIPFACVRAVSDAHDEVLPELNRFSEAGQFQTGKFARWVMLRPGWWPVMMRMGRNSESAAKVMCAELRAMRR